MATKKTANAEIQEVAEKVVKKKRRIRRKNIKRLYKLGKVYYKNKYPHAFL